MAARDHVSPAEFFHGSPSGDLRGGHYGLHVGTEQAAADALNARIGTPAEGSWDGTRIYGKTVLKGPRAIRIDGTETALGEDHYPSGRASYSDGTPVALDSVPEIAPVKIVGEMTNTPRTPHEDFKANGYMAGQVKRGRAKRGYFYENVSEDAGSISAVVPPGGKHLQRTDAGVPKQMRFF